MDLHHFCRTGLSVGDTSENDTTRAAAGPIFATVQALARSNERATASAVAMFSASVLGLGGGPLFVGYLSDFFATGDAANPLRSALSVAAVLAPYPLLHLHLHLSASRLKADVAELSDERVPSDISLQSLLPDRKQPNKGPLATELLNQEPTQTCVSPYRPEPCCQLSRLIQADLHS